MLIRTLFALFQKKSLVMGKGHGLTEAGKLSTSTETMFFEKVSIIHKYCVNYFNKSIKTFFYWDVYVMIQLSHGEVICL